MTHDPLTFPAELLKAVPAQQGSNLVSPIARISFPTLFVPESVSDEPGAKKSYAINLLIPPNADISALKKAAADCATAKWGDKVAEMIQQKKIRVPFLKAEEKKYDGYLPGWTLIRASSQTKPSVRDAVQVPGSLVVVQTDDPEIVYSGRWAQVTLNAFAYDKAGNKGVTFGLNNVMLLHHDESLSGRAKAEDEFVVPSGLGSAPVGGSPGVAAPTGGTIEAMF